MNTNTITLCTKITDVLASCNFRVCSIDEHRGEYCAELETFSPAGEDVLIAIWYNGTNADFVEQFKKYAASFDPDEHAEGWVEYRGQRGVPSGIRDLIDDADAIDGILQNAAEELDKLHFNIVDDYGFTEEYIRENWQEVLESPADYSEIAREIGCGFTRNDLEELMRLHRENICRGKIEDLMEDCNFHTESADWHDGNYIIREG